MLKNSNIGYNWLFQVIIGYYIGIILISVDLPRVCVLLELETTEK